LRYIFFNYYLLAAPSAKPKNLAACHSDR